MNARQKAKYYKKLCKTLGEIKINPTVITAKDIKPVVLRTIRYINKDRVDLTNELIQMMEHSMADEFSTILGNYIKYDFETDGNNYRLTAKMAVLPTDRIDEWCKFQ